MVCSVLKKQLVEGCHLTDSLLPTAFYSSHLTPMASESVSLYSGLGTLTVENSESFATCSGTRVAFMPSFLRIVVTGT